jgi:hypothetical protein
MSSRTVACRTYSSPSSTALRGFPEAITAVFPDAEIQTCIVHLIRNSLSFCNWKQRQPVARELKQIYEAETAELAAKRLEDFAEGPWAKKLPAIVQSWRRVWEQVIPFFAYPKEIRKIIYTTNAIESLHIHGFHGEFLPFELHHFLHSFGTVVTHTHHLDLELHQLALLYEQNPTSRSLTSCRLKRSG